MRATPILIAAWLLSTPAHAQFANRSFGVGANFYKLFNSTEEWAAPLTLEGSLYLENHFDVFLHVPLMVVSTRVGAYTTSGAGLIFGTGGHLGLRYLFLEEQLRPYVGVQLSALVLFKQQGDPEVVAGPGATVGIDYFVADSISIGARGFFDLFLELNRSPRVNLGGGLNFGAYF